MKIFNDLLMSTDAGKIALICFLDLSAAFDTVDHDILASRLEQSFGITGKALDWFKSYLHSRSYCVNKSRQTSSRHDLTCGVPQGSVLGPVLFTLYTSDISKKAADHDVNVHAYADDNQLHLDCRSNDL